MEFYPSTINHFPSSICYYWFSSRLQLLGGFANVSAIDVPKANQAPHPKVPLPTLCSWNHSGLQVRPTLPIIQHQRFCRVSRLNHNSSMLIAFQASVEDYLVSLFEDTSKYKNLRIIECFTDFRIRLVCHPRQSCHHPIQRHQDVRRTFKFIGSYPRNTLSSTCSIHTP